MSDTSKQGQLGTCDNHHWRPHLQDTGLNPCVNWRPESAQPSAPAATPTCGKCGAILIDGLHSGPCLDRLDLLELRRESALAEPLAPYDPRNIGVVVEPFVTNQAPAEPSAGMSAKQWIRKREQTDERIDRLFDTLGKFTYLAELLEAYHEYRVKEQNNG